MGTAVRSIELDDIQAIHEWLMWKCNISEDYFVGVDPAMSRFEIKDSGEKLTFDSGMVRDTAQGKPDFTLIADGPMLERWAMHLTRACVKPDGTPAKYPPRNWMKATGDAEAERFRQSAFRHFIAWIRGDQDEDHAAAVFFNVNGLEYVRANLGTTGPVVPPVPPQ